MTKNSAKNVFLLSKINFKHRAFFKANFLFVRLKNNIRYKTSTTRSLKRFIISLLRKWYTVHPLHRGKNKTIVLRNCQNISSRFKNIQLIFNLTFKIYSAIIYGIGAN